MKKIVALRNSEMITERKQFRMETELEILNA